jgi:hypothetical protein
MAQGFKSGGRKRGTPNRATRDVVERLAALGCDLVAGMAQLAMDEGNAPELRGRMFAELAAYCYPKRRAIEVKAETQPARHVPTKPISFEDAERAYMELIHGDTSGAGH